jgi:hypothetical protein
MTCRVKNCRHPSSHITFGHRCGKCGNFGHGAFECKKSILVLNLLETCKNQKLNLEDYCKVPNCQFKHLHKTSGHQCNKCGKYHGLEECIINNSKVLNFIKKNKTLLDSLPIGFYEQFNMGMNCYIFINKSRDSKLNGLDMHSSKWNQYNNTLEQFLFSYNKIDLIKCPICRNQKNIFGLTSVFEVDTFEKCSICLSESKNLIKLNYCKHVICCTSCFKDFLKKS